MDTAIKLSVEWIHTVDFLSVTSEEINSHIGYLTDRSKSIVIDYILKEFGESAVRALIDKSPHNIFPTPKFDLHLIKYWRKSNTSWRTSNFGIEPDEIYQILDLVAKILSTNNLLSNHMEALCDLEICIIRILSDYRPMLTDIIKPNTLKLLKDLNLLEKLQLTILWFNLQKLEAESDLLE